MMSVKLLQLLLRRIVAQGLHQVYEGLVGSERLHGFINRFQAIEHQAEQAE